MKFKYFSIILLVILSSSCKDQDDSKYQIEEPAKEHGIEQKIEPYQYGPGDVVFRGYLDKTGNMWFATSNEGVFKYDGRTFTNISKDNGLCSNEVNAITQDQNGAIWIGSFARKGVYRYNNDSFVPLEINGSEKLNDIKFVSEDKDGNIWFGGRYGLLCRYDGRNLKDFAEIKRMN